MPARYYDDLFRYFLHQVHDRHEAQDLVQQVFERVLALERAGGTIADERAFLYRAARNLLVDRHRALRLRNHVGEEALAELPASPEAQPDAAYARAQQVRLLVTAIERLPPRCREAFVLHKLEGLPHSEVAARMGVTVNAVERHIMLALATCRKALAGAEAAAQVRSG